MNVIKKERARQIALGYTYEHDKEAGVKHLLYWALRYLLRGKFIKSFALVSAAIDTRKGE